MLERNSIESLEPRLQIFIKDTVDALTYANIAGVKIARLMHGLETSSEIDSSTNRRELGTLQSSAMTTKNQTEVQTDSNAGRVTVEPSFAKPFTRHESSIYRTADALFAPSIERPVPHDSVANELVDDPLAGVDRVGLRAEEGGTELADMIQSHILDRRREPAHV
jgi:hypothetical protein